MNGISHRRRRQSLGVPNRVSIESMDRESLLCEAIMRDKEVERTLSVVWESDDETCRRIGWHLVKNTGMLFHVGRRLLELTSPGSALLPPPEFRLCRETEPTDDEIFSAPLLQPWSLLLFQSGSSPAYWRLGGTVYHPDHDCVWVTARLLYLNRDKAMAQTAEGWVRLGKRMSA
ncbi:hypothetical protein [Rhizobium sp. TRM95796]|uniref:hypothetical protein n=1 Tax=Rhizobium sp. TRM95796 TaxID=2979862 RepID=UPI0021E876CA|nr:hypothetical protein [Rhizobium sp. TRM95796]MCV3768895.1 hypothetical protein [Rhizobium sp. TRM95796]